MSKLDLISLNVDCLDYPERDGISVISYFAGCDRKCTDCQSLSLKTRGEGEKVEDVFDKISKYLREVKLNKLVISGGDPLSDVNYREINLLIRLFKGEAPDVEICVYTGANIIEINEKLEKFPNIKYIKGGFYDSTKLVKDIYPQKTEYGLQLASTNQFFLNSKRKYISVRGYLEF